MSELTDALRALHAARLAEATAKESIKNLRATFEAGIATELTTATAATEARELAEATVRGLAVAAYLESGIKAPSPGVTVVESSKLKYDPIEALKWATEVTPTARIATDLAEVFDV